ncbi:HEAT repeat domain-containing protein [Stenotrophomonas sp. RAC2]|uniref:HEAT repeat domain-containing protein n=1 Tax=Stenotrophomonas sp. RAC2 TaxID=3064902 RepID=UPI00271A24DC|nr:HEAT repeat domain-containing protein [Stenotrophomonas sp. RAC2]MDV9040256.1 HEAT repeat domain-containing protein [Stenotrophomonas sp. RAC2]
MSEAERYPLLAALVAAADNCVATGRMANLTGVCRNEFDRLLNSHELASIVSASLAEVADGHWSHPEWLSVTAEEWVVVDTKDYSLRLVARKPRQNDRIESLNFSCLIGNMSEPAFTINCYQFPHSCRVDEFRTGLLAVEAGTTVLARGQSVEMRAERDIPDVVLRAPAIMLTLYAKVYPPLVWCFERTSLTSVMAVASHESPVRRQSAAAMLQHIHQLEDLPVAPSLETLSCLARDEAHFVRWAALQGLCSIDFNYGRAYLLAAASDPHPAVAAAAKRAIAAHLN